MLNQLKHHYQEVERIDEILAELCKEEIKPLIDAKKYTEAKNAVYKFYGEFRDYAFEKDLIIARINQISREDR